jgi:predicted nucleotidyltransferase
MMGSVAYGVSSDVSDLDVYGFCIPPKDIIFPHLAGEVFGFGTQIKRFEQFQQHHIKDPSANGGEGQEIDVAIYNIVKYFQLCMENNPNMIDSLFTPTRAVLHCTEVGNMVRDARKMFLHKGSWHKFKGYAYSNLHKMDTKYHPARKLYEFEKYHSINKKYSIEEVEKEILKRKNLTM